MVHINKKAKCEVCLMTYRDFCTNYSKRYSTEILKLISHYSSSTELIQFLNSIQSTDIDNLLEAVNDWDETLINTKTVLDSALLKTFLDRIYTMIKSLNNEKTIDVDDVIQCFEKICQEDEVEKILVCFESCAESLASLKHIHLELTDKQLSKRKIMLNIMQKSLIRFSSSDRLMDTLNNMHYRVDVEIFSQSITYKDLNELRDRASLIEHSSNKKPKNDHEREIYYLQLFVHFVDTIEMTLKNLTSLTLASYPSVSSLITSYDGLTCIEGNYQKLINFNSMLETLLNQWEQNLCSEYERYVDLTYFSCQQIWMLESFLYNQERISLGNHIGYHLLQFIGVEPKNISSKVLPVQSEHPQERLRNIGRILIEYRPMMLKQEQNQIQKRILVIETSEPGILRAILSLFKMNDISPKSHQLFYCTQKTSWIDIRAFIYRCFYSQTLHQLIRPEILSSEIQERMIRLIYHLIKECSENSLCMGIITTSSCTQLQLINGLKILQILTFIHDQDLLDEMAQREMIQKMIGINCKLVKSQIPGLGKSTWIRNQIEQIKKQYIKFSINGDIDIDRLAERLRNHGSQLISSEAGIHIDIGTFENFRPLNEFLYSLLLFRSFCFGQAVCSIPSDVPIFIELDASLHSSKVQDSMTILKYVRCMHLQTINWNDLSVSESYNIQLIANYLQCIKDKTVIKKDISEEQMKLIDKETCIRLIQDHFLRNKSKEFITWTQLSIFLAIYNRLFLGFSRCGHFLVKYVPKPELRLDILQSLLDSSDQFTSLSVENVRKNQRSVIPNDAALTYSDAIVRWDKTQPFTMIFTATDDPLFVYKKASNVPESLVQSYCLYQGMKKRKLKQKHELLKVQKLQFPDYDTLTHAQFFVKLTSLSNKYINKSICPRCYKQYEYSKKICEKCLIDDGLIRPASLNTDDIDRFQMQIAQQLQTEYVLTPDNYIKMLLIYLRVQCGLPVLIMGETGRKE
ncbi:unnamed protein product [Rotaria sp. Silwood2]|nr:unnamed protein product [Rotaria sp. Silwood2]